MRGPWLFEEPSCAEVGGQFFFPEPREESYETKLAKRICGTCTHKTECLEWALANENFGIWGGKSVVERKAIRRMRRKGVKPN